MISRVAAAALVAGFLAACVASLLQAAWTTPLILKAESYEKRAAAEPAGRALIVLAHAHGEHAAPHGEDDAWKPAEGLSRTVFTSLATLVGGVGYAFLLIALLLAARVTPSVETGLRWGLGAFLAVGLAPAIGLPPELPGTGGGSLGLRQAWWLFAVAGTGAGLYAVTQIRSRVAVAAGLALIALPHLVGAPHAAAPASEVPAALAAQFATRSLAVSFAFWITLGASLGWAWGRLERRAGALAAA